MIMKTKAPHQNKLMKFITMPIKALAKARDFYVRSMNNYADKACYGGGVASSYMDPLPRSFSTTSSRSEDNEDFRELIRAASTNTLGSLINLGSAHLPSSSNSSLREELQQASKLKRVQRSASVGMAKIEEDKPFDFGVAVAHNIPAASNNINNNNINNNGGPTVKDKFRLFPRSRSYAVGGNTKNSSLF